MKKPIKVAKWISCGELEERTRTQADILSQCGRLLDAACSHEIVGTVLFKATDGRYYTVTVEATIGEANPNFVKNLLEEHGR